MKIVSSILVLVTMLFLCCNGKNRPDEDKIKKKKTHDDTVVISAKTDPKLLLIDDSLIVGAYLIYNDGSLSDFDVLNDKSVMLWNVIAGGGDALKPSDSTKIQLIGRIDGLNIKIKNGRDLIIDTLISRSDRFDYIIKNTGCKEVYIVIRRSNKVIYTDTIPFHCGE